MNIGWLLFGGLTGFFLARLWRANADVKGTADTLKTRISERRQAATWVVVLVVVVITLAYSKGAAP